MNQSVATVGVVQPSNNTILMAELEALLPASTAFSVRSVEATGVDGEALLRMSMEAEAAVSSLTDVDVVVYACASTGYVRGALDDKRFMTQLAWRAGRPCFSAAYAGTRVLQDRGVRRIAVLTPYPADVQELVAPYYTAHGIEIVDQASLDISDIHAMGSVRPERIREAALRLRRDVDALAILGTDIPTLNITADLERELGIPVITTNQAIVWHASRHLGEH